LTSIAGARWEQVPEQLAVMDVGDRTKGWIESSMTRVEAIDEHQWLVIDVRRRWPLPTDAALALGR
jgi:predicted methyltransferase